MAELVRQLQAKSVKGKDVAKHLGIAPARITEMTKGARQIQPREMASLAQFLGITDDPIEQDVSPLGSVPIIGQVAAGNWRHAVQHPIASMPKPDPSVPPQAFALRVTGDSMDLLVEDGGTVIVDPYDKDLFPGRYYVIINSDDEATFKQFRSDPARLAPCSSNPEHKDIPINAHFEIVGRVIWRASRM